MRFLDATLAVLQKDFLVEFRTRYGLNAILLFIVVSVSVMLFSVVGETLEQPVIAALLWNTVFFSAMGSLQRGFVGEAERGTDLFLRLSGSASAIFTGKLVYNFLLSLVINLFVASLYLVTLGLRIESPLIFLLTLLLGSIGIAGTLTLVSAIVANTSGRTSLFAILSFVPLLPIIIFVITATKISTMPDAPLFRAQTDLQLLAAYSAVMLAASVMLFEFVWEE